MVKSAFQALEDVDLVLWLVEAGAGRQRTTIS